MYSSICLGPLCVYSYVRVACETTQVFVLFVLFCSVRCEPSNAGALSLFWCKDWGVVLGLASSVEVITTNVFTVTGRAHVRTCLSDLYSSIISNGSNVTVSVFDSNGHSHQKVWP